MSDPRVPCVLGPPRWLVQDGSARIERSKWHDRAIAQTRGRAVRAPVIAGGQLRMCLCGNTLSASSCALTASRAETSDYSEAEAQPVASGERLHGRYHGVGYRST